MLFYRVFTLQARYDLLASVTSQEISQALIKCFDNSGKLLVAGNGGSMAESDHLVGELINKVRKDRWPLPAISLSNPTVMSAIANDYHFDRVFYKQVAALGLKGDCLITLSTSGTSPNILKAQRLAKDKGLVVIAFPTNTETGLDTQGTQELHLKMIHEISVLVEDHYFDYS